MFSRREFLHGFGRALAAIVGPGLVGRWRRLAAQQALTRGRSAGDFDAFGNVTLLHITDIHAQLKPLYFREPSINLGVGDAARTCRRT